MSVDDTLLHRTSCIGGWLVRVIAPLAIVLALGFGLANSASAETNHGADCKRLWIIQQWDYNMSKAYWWDPVKAKRYEKGSADAINDWVSAGC
jgi:hypothetical protein